MPLTRDLRQSDPVSGIFDAAAATLRPGELEQGAADRVRSACQRTGFFCIELATPAEAVLDAAWRQLDAFFSLPDDDPIKRAVSVATTGLRHGWTECGREPAYQPGTTARVESFDCGRPRPRGGLPAPAYWPEIPEFRNDVRKLWYALCEVGEGVLLALAGAAGIEPRYFADRCLTHELSTLRLLHYPPGKPLSGSDEVGIAAHTDFECITLILQTAPGLELRDVDGNWFDVPASGRRVVVLLGDMLERWTNGRFQATGHRVRPTDHRRHSIVMFFAVDADVLVRPLPPFIDTARPAAYLSVYQGDHLAREVRQAEIHRDSRNTPGLRHSP